jgi:hypothetical protein
MTGGYGSIAALHNCPLFAPQSSWVRIIPPLLITSAGIRCSIRSDSSDIQKYAEGSEGRAQPFIRVGHKGWQPRDDRGCRQGNGYAFLEWASASSQNVVRRRMAGAAAQPIAGCTPACYRVREVTQIIVGVSVQLAMRAAGSPLGSASPNTLLRPAQPSVYHNRQRLPTHPNLFTAPQVAYPRADCVWGTFGCAGFLSDRSVNPHTVATHSFDREGWRPHLTWKTIQ